MRVILIIGGLLGSLLLNACASALPDMPPPVTLISEHTESTQNNVTNYPMLSAAAETTSAVPICERFLSSVSAAEKKMALATGTGGYQMTPLYTP